MSHFQDTYTETLEALSVIDEYWQPGITNALMFLVGEKGIIVDSTRDLTHVFTDVVNFGGWSYDFDQTETVLALCSEFCLLNMMRSGRELHALEVQDNATFFLASQGEFDGALEVAVLRSFQKASIFHNEITRASMCLFGTWDEVAGDILSSFLTRGLLCDSVSSLCRHVGDGNTHPKVFVDRLRKLETVGLVFIDMSKEEPVVTLVPDSAGLFLLFSNRTDLVKRLADISS